MHSNLIKIAYIIHYQLILGWSIHNNNKECSEPAAGASEEISSEEQGVITQPETNVSTHICEEYSACFKHYIAMDPQNSSHNTACEAFLSTCLKY